MDFAGGQEGREDSCREGEHLGVKQTTSWGVSTLRRMGTLRRVGSTHWVRSDMFSELNCASCVSCLRCVSGIL